jgi:2',3'-cyclic-nucleotide 2'-phosphodiesterase (5'-nucleotidase family)
LEAFRKKFKNTPALQVEAGSFLYGGFSAKAPLQNDQVMKSFNQWPVDVLNIGRSDTVSAQKYLAREGLSARAQAMPAIKRMISANLRLGPEAEAPPPYLIKEVTGPRIANRGKKLRVGFIGLFEPKGGGESPNDSTKDMFAAARKFVPELRRQCDLLVIVAHTDLKNAVKLAEENPETDVIIASNPPNVLPPRQIGKTFIVCAAPANTQQGDLRLYLDKQGRVSYKFLSTDLDSLVPSDPAALAYTEAVRQELDRLR